MKAVIFGLLLFCTTFTAVNGLTIRNRKIVNQIDAEPSTTSMEPFSPISDASTSSSYITTIGATGSTPTPGPTTPEGSTESPGPTTSDEAVSQTTSENPFNTPTPPPTLPPPTTQNSGPTSCYALIFAGEMSQSISLQQKQDFLNIVLQIAANFQGTNLKFAITTYGTTIYQNLNDFQDYNQFVSTVNGLISGLPSPNSALTYVAPVLDDIYDDLILYTGKGISTLFMGEMEAIRDPNAGYTAANKIASTRKNVYVLDYSSGAIPVSLWPTLTNGHPERIINGTGSDATTIYNKFYSTLVTDINNNIC